jgi:hypothetical protein
MKNQASKSSPQSSKKVRRIFFSYLVIYIAAFSFIVYSAHSNSNELKDIIWFYFAMGIGSIYVFIAFFSFYENYLLPYITDLDRAAEAEVSDEDIGEQVIVLRTRSVYLWTLEWVAPALLVQFLVVVFFWMTVPAVPYKQELYTQPFMYGQIYTKMNNYMSPEITAAGLTRKLEAIDYKNEKDAIMKSALFLEAEFAGHLKEKVKTEEIKIPVLTDQQYSKSYINSIWELAATIYQIPFFMALTFAFIGSLMYSLNDIVYMYPKTFVSYSVRFLFAPAICMVLAYFFMNSWPINGAPILFFLVGFFPQMALQYIEEKARERLKLSKEKKEEIPLGLIQGMTDYNIYRLKELGVGDAQNLAYSDINYLRENWYNDRQLGDFISQAMLLINLKEDFSKLQSSGIRNIIAFRHVVKDKECNDKECSNFAASVNVDKQKLLNLYNLIKLSPMSERIEALEIIMNKFDENERHKLISGR